MLNEKEVKQLAAILGMMGSSSDGEALNAARLADNFIKQRKLTWYVVFGNVAEAPPVSKATRGVPKHQKMAQDIIVSGTLLSEKEAGFVEDMISWARPSQRQMEWLEKIHRYACGT